MCCLFFFFKQKTAYEMRISDWSSDVSSSDLFRVQLRALLRASKLGRMQILLPMISNLPEFRQACATIDAARHELIGEGYQLAADVPVGAIIEVPTAALVSPLHARHARFRSDVRRVGKDRAGTCNTRGSKFNK